VPVVYDLLPTSKIRVTPATGDKRGSHSLVKGVESVPGSPIFLVEGKEHLVSCLVSHPLVSR
jgi:hypothetical protein